jgi:hypothetical protein
VTVNLATACLITGFIVGWLLRSIFVTAEIARMQGWMQRKVSYWQRETARARATAEHFARQLAAHTGQLPDHLDWPQDDD